MRRTVSPSSARRTPSCRGGARAARARGDPRSTRRGEASRSREGSSIQCVSSNRNTVGSVSAGGDELASPPPRGGLSGTRPRALRPPSTAGSRGRAASRSGTSRARVAALFSATTASSAVDRLAGGRAREAERVAEKRSEREVRGRRLVQAAVGSEHGGTSAFAARSSSISRLLPIPGSAAISTRRPTRRRPRPTRRAATPARRRARSAGAPASAIAPRLPLGSPTAEAWTGSCFPLTRNGSSSVVSNSVRDPSSTSGVATICAVLGLRHQAGGEVDRVAHHRVRAAVEGPDLAGEDRATVDPDVQRQLACAVDDVPERRAASAPRRSPSRWARRR